ncbi:hypothetical protein BKA69DRAFT_1175033 [Paraphysoderma sedebokerense]|nr:hypothetical protein BKA69DRAFT_1175033 [Paraphysoderma sedebokerense]
MDPRLLSQFEVWITIYTVEVVVATAPVLFGFYLFIKTPAEKRSSPSFILGLAQLLCAIGYNVVLICGDIIKLMQIPVGLHRVFTLTIPGCMLFYFTLTLGESALFHSLYQLYRRRKTKISVTFIAFLVLFQAISLALVIAFVIAGDLDESPQRYYAGLKGWGITAGLFTVLTNFCLSISFVSFYKAKLHYAFINRKFVNVLGRISLQHALLPTFFVLPTSYLFIRQRSTNHAVNNTNLTLAIVHQFYLLSFSISVAYAMYQLNLGPRHYNLGHLSKQVRYSAGEIVQAFRHEKKEEAIVERYVREAYLRIGCVSGFIFDWVDESFVPSCSFQLDATLENVNVEFQSVNAESIWDYVLKTAMLKNETVVESSEQIEELSFTLADGNAINATRTIICVPVVSAFGRSFICIHRCYMSDGRLHFGAALSAVSCITGEFSVCVYVLFATLAILLFKDLASMNRELDLKVADRTEELEKQKMELQAAKVKAESSARAKSVFLANMSHEGSLLVATLCCHTLLLLILLKVRTPASQIISAAEMLSDSHLTMEQTDYLNIITSSGRLLLNLLNDILDISKLDSQKLKLECAPFNVHRLIKDTVEAFSVSQPLHVAYFVDRDISHVVIGDALRLQQIFTNLISNALKFTSSGYVFLQARMESYTENANGGLCEMTFSVSDSGSGISKEKMDIIFQRFEQENTSISRLHGGTGLGLAISQDLCGLMNSKLHATSELGRGSTLYFTVKLRYSNNSNIADPNNLAISHTESVLLVTNSGTVLRDSSKSIIQLQLENYGLYNISNKLFSAEALDDLFEFTQSYDYVILDVTSSPQEVLLPRIPLLLQPRQPFIVICTHDEYGDLHEIENLSPFMRLLRYPYKQSMLYQFIQQLGKSAINVPPTLTLTPITMSEKHDIKILLAEDNPVNQKVMKAMFKKLGHTLDIASNGVEAVTMAEKNEYDIIFMDVRMPVMSGLEATAKIRAQSHNRPDRNRTPPIIVGLSADALQENREEGMRVGMDEYLSKPVSKDTMAKILERYGGKASIE